MAAVLINSNDAIFAMLSSPALRAQIGRTDQCLATNVVLNDKLVQYHQLDIVMEFPKMRSFQWNSLQILCR